MVLRQSKEVSQLIKDDLMLKLPLLRSQFIVLGHTGSDLISQQMANFMDRSGTRFCQIRMLSIISRSSGNSWLATFLLPPSTALGEPPLMSSIMFCR
jgi:hypothetical protein